MASPVRLRLTQGALCCLLASAVGNVFAATNCIVPDAIPASAAGLKDLKVLEPKCHKNPDFLYLLGRLLNQLGRYDEAIAPLEGALLYQPGNLVSQIEYAIALEGVGDRASATALLQSLLQEPALDQAAAQQIATLLQDRSVKPVTSGRGSYSLAWGFDDNLLGSTHHTQLELTIPGGSVLVLLPPEQNALRGNFLQAGIRYDGLLASASTPKETHWSYSLAASYRSSPKYSQATLGNLSASLEYSQPDQIGPYLALQQFLLQRASNSVLHQTQLTLGFDMRLGADSAALCQQRLGLDLQQLSYPLSPELNGRYRGLLSQTDCPAWGLYLQARTGQDQPRATQRPGGTQRQYSLRVGYTRRIYNADLAFEWDTSHLQDRNGYSVLLGNNAPRDIRRNSYRLEYRWQLAGTSPYLGFERIDQRANLALFDLKNRVIILGLRSSW